MAVNLTVIVKNTEGDLVKDARVTANPGNFTGTTDDKGEAAITVDGANTYQITVIDGKTSQVVPFYVIGNQTTAKLEVNLEYFKQQQQKQAATTTASMPTHHWYDSPAIYAGLGVAVVVVAVAVILLMRQRKAALTKE